MNFRLKRVLIILCILVFCENIKPISNIKHENNPITFHSHISSFFDDSIPSMVLNKNFKKSSLAFIADAKTSIENQGAKYFLEGEKVTRPDFSFSNINEYSKLQGVSCFRGNSMRDSASYGKVIVNEAKLNILWEKNIGAINNWTGVGWNGQPAIVRWNKDIIKDMNIIKEKKFKDNLTEVIYATLDGNVYFLDLDDGKETRDKLKIGAPVKGSLTVDPRGIPLLYVGQGIDKVNSDYVNFAYRIFSLTDFKKLYDIKGKDDFARRDWGAFDSTSLIDAYNDFLFICGENGVFYSGILNTKYENGKITINPKINKYRYDVPGKEKRGIENSIAIYKNYGYFADNDGMLQCVNLNTLSPVWITDVSDDTDSTVVLEKEEDTLSLYTACEVDHQGINGYSYVRKINGTNGKLLWESKYKCAYDEDVNGGALATPIMGKEDISNLVIFNIARTPSHNAGILVAIDKTTGKEVWNLKLNNYCWSSPVDIYTQSGKSYVVQCDSTGTTMLIEGISGKVLDKIELGANIEGSPAAFGNTLVVGTRGSKIIGFGVK